MLLSIEQLRSVLTKGSGFQFSFCTGLDSVPELAACGTAC